MRRVSRRGRWNFRAERAMMTREAAEIDGAKERLMTERQIDLELLRKAFDVAQRSRDAGDHPFGSILAGPDGAVLREQANGYRTEGGDRTTHSERLLSSWAARTHELSFLSRCARSPAAGPCAMGAGAIYGAGTGVVVYGQREKGLKARTGAHDENPTLDLP